MKNFINIAKLSRLGFLAVTLIAGITIGSSANAQYKATGADGITASPKYRQQLDERRAQQAIKPPIVATMACEKCRDQLVSVPNREPKGSGARALIGNTTVPVAKHLCEACSVDWKVAGTGKARSSVAVHRCDQCGSANLACCAKTGALNKLSTQGMEKATNTVPVK